MNKKTIVILGDSTSAFFGIEEEAYTFKLAKNKVWPANSRIVNCSIPGFTSTDATAYFFNNLNFLNDIHSVVIYLGNCDAMSSEIVKGKYSRYNQFSSYVKSKMGVSSKKNQLKNKLLHFEWNYDYDPEIEDSISLDSFEYNIERIIKYCERKGINVFIINPVANKLFPSGTGKGNFIFYHYLGINDTLSNNFIINDKRFISAYAKYEDRDYAGAAELYKKIILNPISSTASINLEFQTMLVNNFATSKIMMNDIDEGTCLLDAILNERGVRREIILYNLAQAEKYTGNYKKYNELALKSYEEDKSMYRIREPYRNILTNIGEKYKDTILIDLNDVASDSDFVDHCHCLKNIQDVISDKILDSVYFENLKGNHNLEIVNHLYNPEYSCGNNLTFDEYFKVNSELREKEIKEIIDELYARTSSSTLYNDDTKTLLGNYHKSISISFSFYHKHPLTNRFFDILNLRPTYSNDIGRFPEYFIIRKLIPYIRNIESNKNLYNRFDSSLHLLRRSSDFLKILPNKMKPLVSNKIDDFDVEYMRDWLNTIIKNSVNKLYTHLEKGNQVDNRIKTTMFWYFRELLRFGTHSRISMRYDRVTLENITESLAVASVLDSMTGYKMEKYILKLIKMVESIAIIHEKFCCEIPKENRDNYMDKYNSELLLHFNLLEVV